MFFFLLVSTRGCFFRHLKCAVCQCIDTFSIRCVFNGAFKTKFAVNFFSLSTALNSSVILLLKKKRNSRFYTLNKLLYLFLKIDYESLHQWNINAAKTVWLKWIKKWSCEMVNKWLLHWYFTATRYTHELCVWWV